MALIGAPDRGRPPGTKGTLREEYSVAVKSFGVRSAATLALLMMLSGCSFADSVQDSSTCPGESCADDTRDMVKVIAVIEGVVEVEKVSRKYGFDRGSARVAEVTSNTSDKDATVSVGLAVMRALADWPDLGDGAANVIVTPASGNPVTLILSGDWVCEEIDRTRKPCGPDNSWLLTGERVTDSAM